MRTMYIDARTYNNDTTVSIVAQPFMDCVLETAENVKPEGAAPLAVIKAWLESTGTYIYPPEEADDRTQLEVVLEKGRSPFGTDIAYLKWWEEDDVLERFNITYIEMPDSLTEATGDTKEVG